MIIGNSNDYFWIESRDTISELDKLIIKFHTYSVLHIATFDSGVFNPNKDELAAGWLELGEVSTSPCLTEDLQIPYDQFDEWYISRSKLVFPVNLERFVNYGGFSLDENSAIGSETQNRFWNQLSNISPETYVALGDNDIVVSKNEHLILAISQSVSV